MLKNKLTLIMAMLLCVSSYGSDKRENWDSKLDRVYQKNTKEDERFLLFNTELNKTYSYFDMIINLIELHKKAPLAEQFSPEALSHLDCLASSIRKFIDSESVDFSAVNKEIEYFIATY